MLRKLSLIIGGVLVIGIVAFIIKTTYLPSSVVTTIGIARVESAAVGTTYYISPDGNDENAGSLLQPWRTFSRAYQTLQPGSTLVLKDGIYFDSLKPTKSGTQDQPITIRAEKDGAAVINGGSVRVPVQLIGVDWHVIEGIVAHNSSGDVIQISSNSGSAEEKRSRNNIFRRVSAYNSACQTDGVLSACNVNIWGISWSDNNLIEDCVGSGRGRTVSTMFGTTGNVFRRCWFRGDSGTGWQNDPTMHGHQTYMSSNTIFENVVFGDPIVPPQTVQSDAAFDWNNVYGGPNVDVNTNNRYFGNIASNVPRNPFSVSAVQCKLSRDHTWENNVVLLDGLQPQSEWRRGFAVRNGKNLKFNHLTLIGDSASYSSGANQQGFWVASSNYSDQDLNCSPLDASGNHYGGWGFYKDSSIGVPYQHAGFDFTMELKNSIIQGFRVGIDATTAYQTTPKVNNHNNNIQGNGINYSNLTQQKANETNVPLLWNTAMYGRGAYFMGARGLTNSAQMPIGDDGKPVGAEVLYRYQNGLLTNVPLWPWSMEDRVWKETAQYTAKQQSATWQSVAAGGEIRSGGFWKTLTNVYSSTPPPSPIPSTIATPTSVPGGFGAPVTRLPIYCRTASFGSQANKDIGYQKCQFAQDGWTADVAAIKSRAAALGNPSLKVGYYDDFMWNDPRASYSPEGIIYNYAYNNHRDWWLHTGSVAGPYASTWTLPECSQANPPLYCPPMPSGPLADIGNTAFINKLADVAIAYQNGLADFAFMDLTMIPSGGLGGALYSERLNGLYSTTQQYADLVTAVNLFDTRLRSAGKKWVGNGGAQMDLYDASTGVVNTAVRNSMLAIPWVMLEGWLVDFGNLPPRPGVSEVGAFADAGYWNALKGFDAAWDIEQHGHAMLFGCTGQGQLPYADYQAAAGLLVWKNISGLTSFGGCIDGPGAIYPWYSTNLGAPMENYSCVHSGITPTPPNDVTGPLGNIHCGPGGTGGGGVYQRAFQNGKVFVNMSGGHEGLADSVSPAGKTFTLILPQVMKDVVSNVKASQFIIAPKRGLILLNTNNITPTPTPTRSPTPLPSPTPSSSLQIGDRVKVNIDSLNVKSSASGPVINKITLNTLGTIMSGPTPYLNYIWWEVSYDNGMRGWSAQGIGATQYLVKTTGVGPTPTPPASPSPVGGPSPTPSVLHIGDRARVNVNLLNVRSSPFGLTTNQVTLNTLGTIITGPTSYLSYIWWEISYDNGMRGWSAQGIGATQYLVKTTGVGPTPSPGFTPSPTRGPSPTPSVLHIGDRARVNVNLLNVRSSPFGLTTNQVTLNTQGTIMSGPTPYLNYIWWEISYDNGMRGWSAQGIGATQYLVKI